MRLRYQTKGIIYEVRSVIKFDRRGEQTQKTYYGSEYPMSKESILNRARHNIEKKFERSSGRILKLQIVRVYQ